MKKCIRPCVLFARKCVLSGEKVYIRLYLALCTFWAKMCQGYSLVYFLLENVYKASLMYFLRENVYFLLESVYKVFISLVYFLCENVYFFA